MIRTLSAFVLGMFVLAVSSSPVVAEEPKGKAEAVKLEGTITCPKCDLGTADKCGTLIKVKDKIYVFDAASHKKYHAEICTAAKEGKVEGTVKKDGDKMVISVTKLEFKK